MFTLNVKRAGVGFDFMIVNPDMNYVSGHADDFAHLAHELLMVVTKHERINQPKKFLKTVERITP